MGTSIMAPRTLARKEKLVSWVFQVLAAIILLQTLFFKFTGAEESVYIFTQLGAEPWGRIASGVVELIAGTPLLIPRTAALGALLSLGVVTGALVSHLTILGITLPAVGDHGELFGLGVTVFISSLIVLFIRHRDLPFIGAKL